MGESKAFLRAWNSQTLHILPFWKSSRLYKKIFSEGDFPRRCSHSNAREYKSRKALALRPKTNTGYKWGPAGKSVFQLPKCPAPFHWVQEFAELLLKRKWEKFTVPFVRNHGRKMEHPPGARGEKWSRCQETVVVFSFTPKPLSLKWKNMSMMLTYS